MALTPEDANRAFHNIFDNLEREGSGLAIKIIPSKEGKVMPREIIRYYKKKGQPVGCVLALDEMQIGWSLCNPKDHFDKKKARMIARNRAMNGGSRRKLPQSLHETYSKVIYDLVTK